MHVFRSWALGGNSTQPGFKPSTFTYCEVTAIPLQEPLIQLKGARVFLQLRDDLWPTFKLWSDSAHLEACRWAVTDLWRCSRFARDISPSYELKLYLWRSLHQNFNPPPPCWQVLCGVCALFVTWCGALYPNTTGLCFSRLCKDKPWLHAGWNWTAHRLDWIISSIDLILSVWRSDSPPACIQVSRVTSQPESGSKVISELQKHSHWTHGCVSLTPPRPAQSVPYTSHPCCVSNTCTARWQINPRSCLLFTLIVSSGCPAKTRQTPPKPPAKKFFSGLIGCGCLDMFTVCRKESEMNEAQRKHRGAGASR